MSDLTALLEQEAGAEIDAILAEARSRAAELIAQAQSEAEAAAAARARASKAQGEALLVRAQSAAQLEAAALRLRAEHEAVEGVLASVRERLDALADESGRYEAVLGRLVEEAVEAIGAESVTEIAVGERDVKLAKRLVGGMKLEAPVVAGAVRGGVRVRGRRGSSVEHSLHGRLGALREELASRISEVLFDETEE